MKFSDSADGSATEPKWNPASLSRRELRSILRPGPLDRAIAWGVVLILAGSAAGQKTRQPVSLDPATGEDLYLQTADRHGNLIAPPPENVRRMGTSACVGSASVPHRLTLRFHETTKLTEIESTRDFPVEPGGSCIEGNIYGEGETCSLFVRFTAQGPGRRFGRMSIHHSASAEPFTIGLNGEGCAPAINFTPSVITTVPGTFPANKGLLSQAHNLAVDGGDTLYVADTANQAIRMVNSAGLSTVTSAAGQAWGITVDSAGEIWFSQPAASHIFKIGLNSSAPVQMDGANSDNCRVSSPCLMANEEVFKPGQMSITSGDLMAFEVDSGLLGISSVQPSPPDLFYGSEPFGLDNQGNPTAMSIDEGLNLYFSPSGDGGQCYIDSQTIYDAENFLNISLRIAGRGNCGYSGDGGQAKNAEIGAAVGQMAFDAAGDLYFTDTQYDVVRRIDFNTGIIRTIAGHGLPGYTGDGGAATAATLAQPTGVAVDSQGQVYIISATANNATTEVIRKVGQTGVLNFGNQPNSLPSAAQTILVTNTGNQDMELTRAVINGANAGEFVIDPNTTTCMLSPGAVLASGSSCRIGVSFTPKAAGARTANLVLLDNTILGADTVNLSGTGTLSTPTVTVVMPASGQTFSAGASVTFKVSVGGVAGVPAPTGNVQFKLDNANHGSPVAIASGGASVTLTGLKAGIHYLQAIYLGNGNYGTANSLIVPVTLKAAATLPSRVTLARASSASQACGQAGFTVAVTGQSTALATGKVELLDGARVVATGTLTEAKVTLHANLTATSNAVLIAHYAGDARHMPANSSGLKLGASTLRGCGSTLPTRTKGQPGAIPPDRSDSER